jgi:hypothetical protein
MSRPALGPFQPPIQWVPGFLPGSKWPDHDLTTHLHLVPGLKMSGAMPLLPLYASMAWTGETLLYNGSCPKFQA